MPLHPVFLLGNVAHHEASNFIKRKLQHRCFTVNFAKLLKALCRTPPVSASNLNSTFLTLRACRTYIYVFPALLFLIFLSRFMFLIEARNISIWFYTKIFSQTSSIFDALMHQFSTAQQTSTAKLPEFFSRLLNRSER